MGALVNITSAHINWIASFLATEFDADLVTAPEVTTLNGKNVTFRSGAKVPFQIGQNIITNGGAQVTNQFFYKHVGAYISVTPQIVNWGKKHAGRGRIRADYEAGAIIANDIVAGGVRGIFKRLLLDDLLPLLVKEDQVLIEKYTALGKKYERFVSVIRTYLGDPSASETAALRKRTATALNSLVGKHKLNGSPDPYTRDQVFEMFGGLVSSDGCLDWDPADCTINVNIAVRLSDNGTISITEIPNDPATNVTAEQNVRAISNVVQLKSGHGVVIGGLIGMQDQAQQNKVPVLGDIPWIGSAFRSKVVSRIKTETLIFLEVSVLPPSGKGADWETRRSFCSARRHLECDLCSSELYYGLYHAGLTNDYLPPLSDKEMEFFDDYHESLMMNTELKIHTQLDDIFGK